jgi:hypothetical protein
MSKDQSQPRQGWHLIVNGSQEHQRILEALSLEGVALVQHNGNWLLYLEEIQEAFLKGGLKDRLEEGQRVLGAINGLAERRIPFPDPLDAEKIGEVGQDGQLKASGFVTAQREMTTKVSLTVRDEEGNVEEYDHIDLTTPERPHALSTPRRRRSLQLMAGEPGFRELYVVLEDAIDELGGSSGIQAAGVSWEEVKRFKQTANSHETLGEDARHGASKEIQPPDDPMSIEEARTMIDQIVDHWIAQEPGSS